ncbi:MAG: flagellar M-ring protein FliF [Clostridia bacterium]|nr:flagellar M-ring protein FliF [Clostridia bacterium]
MKLADLRDRFKEFWQGLTPGRRSALVVVTVAFLVAAIFLGQWLLQPQYVPIFSNLQQRDAAAVVEKLKELDVPYRLAGEGTTILVPKDQLYQLRLDLAGSGVLTSGQGFELFDKNRLGMTDFERNLDYQRALQGELQRTIAALDEVEDARVHLVIPQPTVFLREQQPPSAAVMLKLKPLAQLKPEQVKGIMELVAASVAGLELEAIRVIDTQGNVLSEGLDDSTGLSLSKQQQLYLELTRQYEKDLEARLQAMLSRLLGPGSAVAMVTAELNFDQQEIKQTTYGPGVLLSEQISTEQSSGAAAGGIPGVTENTQPPLYEAINPAGGSYSRSDVIHNYQNDVTESSTIVAPGQVRRLSTAVVVNGPLSPELNEQIEQIVTAAIGYQPDRGDQISVSSMAFDDTLERQMAEELEDRPEERGLWSWLADVLSGERGYLLLAAGLGVIALLLLLVWILRRRRQRQALAPPFAEETDIPIEPLTLEEPETPEDIEKRQQEASRRAKQERAREVIRQRPEDAAVLIRAWLAED